MMMKRPLKVREAALLGLLVATTTLLFDLSQPLNVAGGMPYLALPLLGLLARSRRLILVAAFAGVGLSLAGMLFSPAGAPIHVALINRGMSVALTVIIAMIATRHLAIGARLRRSLENQAARDPLTGLYNRRHVFRLVEGELKRHRRYGTALSVILIDADHFKRVNDIHGHCAGDAALRSIASVCTTSVRETDVVGRFGGEEFIVLLPHTDVTSAAVVAQRIRRRMDRTRARYRDRRIRVTLSLGVAEARPGADGFDELLRLADEALYAAKRAGRNRVATALPDAGPNVRAA